MRERAERRGETEQRGQTVQPRPLEFYPPNVPTALVPYFSRNVVAVDGFLLQKHVKTAFVLGERVAGDPAHTHAHSRELVSRLHGADEHIKLLRNTLTC